MKELEFNTVDLRSDIAVESRTKIVYEYLLQFTEDPLVKDTLRFLMTREVAHFQMFSAALESIEHNFPPGQLQGDPHYSHVYMNMSNGTSVRGPWNQGQGPWGPGESWEYVDDPIKHVLKSKGMIKHGIKGSNKTPEEVEQINRELSRKRSEQAKTKIGTGANQWSSYPATDVASPTEPQDESTHTDSLG